MYCPMPILVKDSSLEDCKVIGSGGFGQVYKARHREWGCDVAIKLLHYDDGNSKSLLHEIDMMRLGSCPHVIQVRGVFKGQLPTASRSTQCGLVMEYMEKGSLASLQETLGGAPPWPLVFRLAHQVALGINFLHSLSPPLLHLDLKPSNVLLDCSLNAKLTDFGLARFYHSITRASTKDNSDAAGTINYMPPEAFDLSYSPTRASDIYSYGILLWSIVTGKQPYAFAESSLVRFRIPEGDRPSLEEIRSQAMGLAGLTRLMDLMQRCWDPAPKTRPFALECATESEELYKMHKHATNDAVHQVLKKLDQEEEERMTERFDMFHIAQASVSECVEEENICENVQTGPPPIQEMAGGSNQRVKDPHSSRYSSVCYDDVSKKVSSVLPIGLLPPSSSPGQSSQGRTENTSPKAFMQNLPPQYQRQCSSPNTFPCRPASGIQINCSNVTGFQQGNNNIMHIHLKEDLKDRKRHPTAPPRVDLPPPQPGS